MAAPTRLEELPFAAALQRHQGALAPDAQYDAVHFDAITLDGADGRGAVFLECAFTRLRVQGGSLRRARFGDVWLRDAQLMSVDLVQTSWTDATWLEGVAAGVVAYGSTLRKVTFIGCKLDSVNLREAKLTDVKFENCLLRDVDFGGATISKTVFAQSQLKHVTFTKASLEQVDLRGSELDIVAGPDSLRGAIISSAQLAGIAGALAEGLGIIVTDE